MFLGMKIVLFSLWHHQYNLQPLPSQEQVDINNFPMNYFPLSPIPSSTAGALPATSFSSKSVSLKRINWPIQHSEEAAQL